MAGEPKQGWATKEGIWAPPPRQVTRPQDVAAKLAIAELFARYGFAHDEVVRDAMSDLFTQDAVLEVSLAGPVFERHEGRDNIIANFVRVAATQSDQRRHAIANLDVTLTGDRVAVAHAYGLVSCADAGGVQLGVACVYRAEAVCETDGFWRFSRLWIGMDHYAGDAPGHS